MSQRFEAVILRFVPDAGSGEVLNVGVAMRTHDGDFFDTKCIGSLTRVTDAFPETHAPTVRAAFKQLGTAVRRAFDDRPLPLSTLTAELRRLAPDPDGALQWSEPVSGVTADPRRTFEQLYARYVDRHTKEARPKISRSDEDVENALLTALRSRGVEKRLASRELRSPNHKTFARAFKHCWKNGIWNCVEPVSLDLVETKSIQEKATNWIGNVRVLNPSSQDARVVLFVGMPSANRKDALEAANDAVAALEEQVRGEATIYREEQADDLAARVEADLH